MPNQENSRFISMFDSAVEGLWIMNTDGEVSFYNHTFYKQFDLDLDKSHLDDWLALIHPLDKKVFSNHNKDIKPSTFQNKINAHRAEHKLNIEEFIYVLLVLQQENTHSVVLQDFLSLFGFRLEYISEINEPCDFDHKSFMEAWMNFNKEHGDVQIALTAALSDYKITTNELNGIKKELAEQIEAMTTLRFALDNVCGKQLV